MNKQTNQTKTDALRKRAAELGLKVINTSDLAQVKLKLTFETSRIYGMYPEDAWHVGLLAYIETREDGYTVGEVAELLTHFDLREAVSGEFFDDPEGPYIINLRVRQDMAGPFLLHIHIPAGTEHLKARRIAKVFGLRFEDHSAFNLAQDAKLNEMMKELLTPKPIKDFKWPLEPAPMTTAKAIAEERVRLLNKAEESYLEPGGKEKLEAIIPDEFYVLDGTTWGITRMKQFGVNFKEQSFEACRARANETGLHWPDPDVYFDSNVNRWSLLDAVRKA